MGADWVNGARDHHPHPTIEIVPHLLSHPHALDFTELSTDSHFVCILEALFKLDT
jgi:hypothetical protein